MKLILHFQKLQCSELFCSILGKCKEIDLRPHITDNDIFHVDYNVYNIPYSAIMQQGEILANLQINRHSPTNPRR